jgi:hypothetical protein
MRLCYERQGEGSVSATLRRRLAKQAGDRHVELTLEKRPHHDSAGDSENSHGGDTEADFEDGSRCPGRRASGW